ncbi:unnamed protein product [Mycena citricolor]|uniref:BTB domain-containing protein n=1 Tax=Mycena citricolor TaxID=2018698 RepID=A0AAD2GXC7_9AGAR|nr:unnamed protein product [Mycena citricolor]
MKCATTRTPTPSTLHSSVESGLANMLLGKDSPEIKFYAYTRKGVGYVRGLEALYAKKNWLMGHSDELDQYLEGVTSRSDVAGFKEARIVSLEDHIPDEDERMYTGYHYMDDSDLEDDDESDVSDEDDRMSFTSATGSVDHSEALLPITNIDNENPPQESCSAGGSSSTPVEPERSKRMGHVVILKGHAFRTWHAFLFYLYMGHIRFSDAKSAAKRVRAAPACSAKSIYLLADQFGLPELKSLAFTAICAQLSVRTIVKNAFSHFTSWHPEVQDVQIEFLLAHLREVTDDMDRMLRSLYEAPSGHSVAVSHKVFWKLALGAQLITALPIAAGGVCLEPPILTCPVAPTHDDTALPPDTLPIPSAIPALSDVVAFSEQQPSIQEEQPERSDVSGFFSTQGKRKKKGKSVIWD